MPGNGEVERSAGGEEVEGAGGDQFHRRLGGRGSSRYRVDMVYGRVG